VEPIQKALDKPKPKVEPMQQALDKPKPVNAALYEKLGSIAAPKMNIKVVDKLPLSKVEPIQKALDKPKPSW
jgi:hypothetical protein